MAILTKLVSAIIILVAVSSDTVKPASACAADGEYCDTHADCCDYTVKDSSGHAKELCSKYAEPRLTPRCMLNPLYSGSRMLRRGD